MRCARSVMKVIHGERNTFAQLLFESFTPQKWENEPHIGKATASFWGEGSGIFLDKTKFDSSLSCLLGFCKGQLSGKSECSLIWHNNFISLNLINIVGFYIMEMKIKNCV